MQRTEELIDTTGNNQAAGGILELAIVVPAYNERPNVKPLLASIERTLEGVNWEVIFVDDDSRDGTAAEVHSIGISDQRVRCLRRIGRRGLASAVIEGMLATSARYIAVMDADLQHDERLLTKMLSTIRGGNLDLVVASRHLEPGGMGEFAADRVRLSGLGTRLSRFVANHELSDPMSGFFLVTRGFFEEVVYDLSAVGFKILLDIVASAKREVRFAEVPYTFRLRQFGESKLDINVGLEYLYLLLDKLVGHVIPLRFATYATVGMLGVVLHLFLVWVLHYRLGTQFVTAQITGTYIAMLFNFVVNNVVTFRDRQLRGRALALGLFTFVLACSVGALANVSVAESLFRRGTPLYLAAAFGLVVSSVWNYAINEVFTWRKYMKTKIARTTAAAQARVVERAHTCQ